MPLRYYQRAAVDSVFNYWGETAGNPLIDMATGTGKSMTLATLFQELATGWPGMRLVCVTHVIELVVGNYQELMGVYPFAPAGIYASAIGRREANQQILFAQLQTVWNKAAEIGHVDVLAIDEVHLVPTKDNTMYRQFIADLLAINPDMKIVGLSATPYRLDSGRLDEGDDRLFDRVVYTYGIREGIDDGYLTPITSKPTATHQDTSHVPMSGHDLAKSALQKAVDQDWLNERIVDEVFDTEGRRRTALFFCAGVKHAGHIRDAVRARGRSCEVLHGGTPPGERRTTIERLKAGDLWAVANDNVMSTGTNVPRIDLIVDLARTKSASRYVQRVGRGTRVVYPPGFRAEECGPEERRAALAGHVKPNCRYMDFAGNIKEHGPVDMICPTKPKKGEGEAPIKVCPKCFEQLHASLRICWSCGHEFDIEEKPRFEEHADTTPILSVKGAEWLPVRGRRFRYHDKPGGTPSVRVEYTSGLQTYPQWLCPQHESGAKYTSDKYWLNHGGRAPPPRTVDDFISRSHELRDTAQISIEASKKYRGKFDVVGARPAANDNTPAANDNLVVDIDDAITF